MMKMRQLMVATVVLAALAATLYWSNHRKAAADSAVATPSVSNAKSISLTSGRHLQAGNKEKRR